MEHLVQAVRAQLASHSVADEREERSVTRIIGEMLTLARPFDENAQSAHITGSALVMGRRGTVLHLHKKLRRWMQPGGHIEEGETPWEAALRESQEETGLELRHPSIGPRLIHVDLHDAADAHVHGDLRYLLLAPDEDPNPPPGESPEVRWFTWEEAERLADNALVGAIHAVCRQAAL